LTRARLTSKWSRAPEVDEIARGSFGTLDRPTRVCAFMDRAQKNQGSYDQVAAEYLERSRDRSLLRPWMLRSGSGFLRMGSFLIWGLVRVWTPRSCERSACV
jgi:hypothetical protein